MAKAKSKVELRMVKLLGELRDIHGQEDDPEVREILRQLILKQCDALEWVQLRLPNTGRQRTRDPQPVIAHEAAA